MIIRDGERRSYARVGECADSPTRGWSAGFGAAAPVRFRRGPLDEAGQAALARDGDGEDVATEGVEGEGLLHRLAGDLGCKGDVLEYGCRELFHSSGLRKATDSRRHEEGITPHRFKTK